MSSPEALPELADLATTWRTLLQVADNYHLGSPGEAVLIEARRLIEIEVRSLYGDEAWSAMTTEEGSR